MNNKPKNNIDLDNLPFDNQPSLKDRFSDTYTYSDFKFDKKKVKKNSNNNIFDVEKNHNNKQRSSLNEFELRNRLKQQQQATQPQTRISEQQLAQAESERKARLDQIMQQGQSRPSAKQQRLTKDQIEQAIDLKNRNASHDPAIISGKRKPLKPEYNGDFGTSGSGSGGNNKPPRKLSLNSGSKKNKPTKNKKTRNRKIRRIVSIILLIFLTLIALLLSFLFYIKSTAAPLHLTVIGVDQRAGQSDKEIRADAIMNLNVGTKDNKILMASIPRDTYTYVPCEEQKDKITHSFIYGALNWENKGGGIACTVDSVEQLIGVHDNNKYVKVNFENMVGIIDAIGGIDHKPTATFCEQSSTGKKNAYCFKKGKKTHMDGEMALAYSRHRKSDSDVARGLRQQEIMKAMAAKVKNANVFEWPSIYTKVRKMVDTNLSTKELLQIALVYATKGNIESYEFDWSGVYYGGVSYVELSENSVSEYGNKIKALR
ncbi:LCP family protein [Mycoplasma sp. P36-A1]|uniref:LCP family protein n=1 Tax=Mycoplasma sp. P36-A1 TaxID=3252900 RepID=UPI003C305FFB